jgi:hypothetical protein
MRRVRYQARISVSFDDTDYVMLCALAQRHKVSVAWIVRQGVHGLIEQEKTRQTNLQLPLISSMARHDYAELK